MGYLSLSESRKRIPESCPNSASAEEGPSQAKRKTATTLDRPLSLAMQRVQKTVRLQMGMRATRGALQETNPLR